MKSHNALLLIVFLRKSKGVSPGDKVKSGEKLPSVSTIIFHYENYKKLLPFFIDFPPKKV
jgi:hypothetical protein